jgi:acyl-coenzyme A thioesterase PaaI-like protein
LLDSCCGLAVAAVLTKPQPFATLDLRIDYVRPATPKLAVIADAECYKVTSNVAFVRAFAYHTDKADPIAAASGTFMLATKGMARLNLGGD